MYKVTEDQKVRLASLVSLDYVIQWGQQTLMDIKLKKRPFVVTWSDLKLCMRVRLVPPRRKEHLWKLQQLHQGPRTVKEYFVDLVTTLTKINIG